MGEGPFNSPSPHRFWKSCKPNSVCARCRTERIIGLSGQYPRSDFRRGAGSSGISYLALLPMGFSVPPRLLLERWALTPPFHPYRQHTEFTAAVLVSVALSVTTL